MLILGFLIDKIDLGFCLRCYFTFDMKWRFALRGEYTIAPITYISLSEKSTKGDLLPMLTITDLIAVISLCATFYSLGYVRGKHDSKTQR